MSRASVAVLGFVVVSALSVVSAAAPATSYPSSGGETKTLLANADTFVRAGDTNANQGAWSYLRVRASGENRALVRFDQAQLAAAIGTGRLVSATITLDILRSSGWSKTRGTISVHRLLSDWAEGNGSNTSGKRAATQRGTGPGATWDCAVDANIANRHKDCSGATEWEMGRLSRRSGSTHPWIDTATATATIQTNQSGSLSFDVTADVVAFLSGEATNNGWIVKKDAESQPGRVRFSSRETSSGPQLVVVVQVGDTKAPEVEPIGLSVQDPIGDYVNGQDAYSVDVSASDVNTGVARVAIGQMGDAELAESEADCSDSCPMDYSETLIIDASGFEEGAHQLIAMATDGAGNIGTSEPWTMWVDRTAPELVTNLRIARFDESSNTTTVGWDAGDDPQLTDGSPGSGVQSYEYRYKVGEGDWTDVFWTDFPEFDIGGRALGDIVDVEVAEADEVGNVSDSQTASLTVFEATEAKPWYDDTTPDPGTDVVLSDEQSAQAVDLTVEDPRISSLAEGLGSEVTDVAPWSMDGTQDTIIGADVTIGWQNPSTLEADWPLVGWSNEENSYTVQLTHYRLSDVTSLEVFVTFEPSAVVGFEPADGTADTASINQVKPSTELIIGGTQSIAPMSLSARTSVSASVPDWVHAPNPRQINDRNSWFTNGDYFWNYDFNTKSFDLTNKTDAQSYGDWPVTVIFTNQARLSLVKTALWSGRYKAPMYMKLYDRGSDPLKKPVWDKDSGEYTGQACYGTKYHYRLYGPDTDMGGDGSFYNSDLGYYVVATTHVDYHDQTGKTTWTCYGGQWTGEADVAEAKLVRAAIDVSSPRFYPKMKYFNLFNRDMRGIRHSRHYKSDGYATNICVKVTDPNESCWQSTYYD
jgi:hypothetical protein